MANARRRTGGRCYGNAGNAAAAYFELGEPIETDASKPLTFVFHQGYGENHTLGKFRLSATVAPKPIRAPNAQAPAAVLAAIKVEPAQRTDAQRAEIAKHFRSIATAGEVRVQLAEAQQSAPNSKTDDALHRLRLDAAPRTVRILPRGNWMDESGEVGQGRAARLSAADRGSKAASRRGSTSRSGSCRRENPLTARAVDEPAVEAVLRHRPVQGAR